MEKNKSTKTEGKKTTITKKKTRVKKPSSKLFH